MGTFSQDIRYALRQLRKSPAFALTAIVTLGLGIGVNAAMFSVVEQVLLRSLPYAHESRLVALENTDNGHVSRSSTFSLPDLHDYVARSHSLEGIAWYTMQLPTLGGTENPQLVPQLVTSPNLFAVLGIHPQMGRGFTADDAKPDRNHVLILSNSVWKKFYQGDPSIIGRVIPINGDPYTVIGVMPAGIFFPMGAGDETFSPLNGEDKSMEGRGDRALEPIALLRPGITLEQAQSELNGIHTQLLHDYPKDELSNPVQLTNYHDSITRGTRPALFALDWAVLAVWLIACANVAGLMLTRTNGRRREIAIRGALGAQRGRIARQFLTESLLLSAAGAAAGLGIAFAALSLLKKYLADTVLYGGDIHVNGAVFAFLILASCISALLFGLAPAWHASSVPAQEGLREGSAAAGTSKRQALWRDGLVVTEITLTLALLIAAGLMMRTLMSLRHTDLGFATENVVTGSMFLPTHGPWWVAAADPKTAPNMVHTFFDPLAQKLQQMPGIEAVGFTTVRPLSTNLNFDSTLNVKGHPAVPKAQEPDAQVRAATSGYFSAMGMRLLAGRLFSDEDTPETPIKLVVNQALAKKVFPRENPLGQQIEIGDDGPRQWGTIVGVVEDARQRTLGEAATPEMSLDLEQITPADAMYSIFVTFHTDVVVRGRMVPGMVEDTIRRDVHALRPEIAIDKLEPMQQIVDDSLGNQTLAARLLGIFGLAALLIAVAGIYGLLAYSVSQRTRELGVRIALGAAREDILWLILRHALVLLGVGSAVGLAVAWGASGVMRSFLYGAVGYDAVTVVLVVVTLGACGLLASYLPAQRAAGIDPVEALRSE
ncbi:MAG TPA: ABC transporter permease [Acidobacteriaceae bacterium]|jgi:predicted permease|nr:ABC transporter permease [Acidobacteriaceae bacterium]